VRAVLIYLSIPLAISGVLHKLGVIRYSDQWDLLGILGLVYCAIWLIAPPPRRVRGLIERNYRILGTVGLFLLIAYTLVRLVWHLASREP